MCSMLRVGVPGQAAPTESSKVGHAKHSEAVAQVRWVDRGPDHAELLISISPDGRVTSWSLSEVGALHERSN